MSTWSDVSPHPVFIGSLEYQIIGRNFFKDSKLVSRRQISIMVANRLSLGRSNSVSTRLTMINVDDIATLCTLADVSQKISGFGAPADKNRDGSTLVSCTSFNTMPLVLDLSTSIIWVLILEVGMPCGISFYGVPQ
jgi:hypothetical protein